MSFFEFPHTRTYDSDLAWLIRAYKILTGKVNNIEQTIEDTINEALQGEELKQFITQLIAEALPLNVKYPPAESGLTPAVGDGETDDTAALQAMIEYGSEHGLPMIFPAGIYRVSNLSVTETANFLGMEGVTIFKTENSSNALISVSGNFNAFNITFNGNIAGNDNPQDIITGTCENISVNGCNFTGCTSCFNVNISKMLEVTNCRFENYTEYGVNAEGTGRVVINGMEIVNVANSGAMRFVKLGCSNSIIDNLTSLSSVPVGVEITGDFNDVKARIPNCENPVIDGGENNSYNIIGQEEQIRTNSYTENIDNTKTINANDIILNPKNPLTYKKANKLNNYFNFIEFKDPDNNIYNVLVEGNLNNLIQIINVKDYGASGDGSTDDYESITNALNYAKAENMPVLFPSGTYFTSQTLDISGLIIFGQNSTITGNNLRTIISASNTTALMFGITVTGETCQTGITYYKLSKGQIINCEVKNIQDYGIEISECKKISIQYNEIHDITNESGIAFSIPDTSFDNEYINLSFNKIYNIGLDGISVQGFSANITNNVINNVGVKTPAAGIYATNLRYSNITCNAISSCAGNGIDIAGDNVNNINVNISENSISTVAGSGVLLQNGNGFRVENNFIYKVGYSPESLEMDLGISIRAKVYYVYAIQNHFADCQKGGIYLTAGSGPLTEGFSNFENTTIQFKSNETTNYNKIDFTVTPITN